MNDFFDNWTVQVRKGVLELCILNALAEKERYGYELVKTLVAIPGLGVTEGTLYPLLSRLRVQGLCRGAPGGILRRTCPKILRPDQGGPQGDESDERVSRRAEPRHAQAAGKEHHMSQWTDSAKAKLEQYLAQMRQSLAGSGADANEVAEDLRRHVEEEAAARKLSIVTEQDVAQILARIGAPEAVAAADDRAPCSAALEPAPPRVGSFGSLGAGCCCSSVSCCRSGRWCSSS